MCIYIYIYICMYVCIYIYIYINTWYNDCVSVDRGARVGAGIIIITVTYKQ